MIALFVTVGCSGKEKDIAELSKSQALSKPLKQKKLYAHALCKGFRDLWELFKQIGSASASEDDKEAALTKLSAFLRKRQASKCLNCSCDRVWAPRLHSGQHQQGRSHHHRLHSARKSLCTQFSLLAWPEKFTIL